MTFQSTLPRRERQVRECTRYCLRGISIHAPTKGATNRVIFVQLGSIFQSTLPRRERRYHFKRHKSIHDFNPRSHEGSDADAMARRKVTVISIHAPTKGATWRKDMEYVGREISIHAPTKGATLLYLKSSYMREFQSTLPRRERQRYD